MKFVEDLASKENQARLIPSFKQPERRLLSVFLALLDISPTIRGIFLTNCGYGSGKTCTYESHMEVHYPGTRYSDVRPDGLVFCRRGKACWSSFVEAKAEKSQIRPEQISDYIQLASQLGVDAVITISNEFAREPEELPYHIAPGKRKSLKIYHFSWADIRTQLTVSLESGLLSPVEHDLVAQCLMFFWDEKSGIQTYDAMPEVWPAFVEAASTKLGFGSNQKGLAEIVSGWQQERRDLCSKLILATHQPLELRHRAGVRSSDEDRQKQDRQLLANDYLLTANYYFRETKLELEVIADLRACRVTASLDVPLPENKGAKATATGCKSSLQVLSLATQTSSSIGLAKRTTFL